MKLIFIVFFILSLVRCPREVDRTGKSREPPFKTRQSTEDLMHEFCMSTTEKLFDFYNQLVLSFNLVEAYEKSPSELGEGAFGKVVEICYPPAQKAISGNPTSEQLSNWPRTVAVKQIKIVKDTLKELQILYTASKNGYGPKFYGCYVDKPNKLVYTVQEKLSSDFFDSHVKTAFDHLTIPKKLTFYEQLFKQAIRLYNDGFINNDIKLDNMLFDESQRRLYIIDYGLATFTDEPLLIGGTPLYLSPEKLKPKRSANLGKLEDDLYSVAISIVYIEGGQSPVYECKLISWKWQIRMHENQNFYRKLHQLNS